MKRRFRYTPSVKYPQCPSFVATFVRVETEGAMKGWTTFKKDGDDDHLYSMFFTPEDNIEWFDDDDVQALEKAEPSDTTFIPDNSPAVVSEQDQQPKRKTRKRKRKVIPEIEQQDPEQSEKRGTENKGLFDMLFMVVSLLLIIGIVALGPGLIGFAAMFGAGGALVRAE